MKQTRAPFVSVTPDIDDDALESLAREKGVGAMVKPIANRAGEGAIAPAASTPTSAPSSVASSAVPNSASPSPSTAVEPSAEAPTPRSRMKSINIELPDYVWTDLKIRAAREQVSLRHVIMTALKGQGVAIADVDMVEDGRRLRS